MGSKYFLILLLILAACETAIQTVPTSEYQPTVIETGDTPAPTDICKDVNCTKGQICKQGQCVCQEGKLCDNKCIPEEACCKDNDCPSGKCEKGKCTKAECSLGQEFKNGECQCTADMVYCEEQKKCIQKGKCCVHGQCKQFEKCMQTMWKISLCIQTDDKKQCKIFGDQDRTELYTLNNLTFKAKPVNWWNDKSVTFEINNQTIRLKENVQVNFSNATMYQEGITVSGGYCKEDVE